MTTFNELPFARIPPFIGFPENTISHAVRLEPDMDATFKEK